MVRRTLNTLGFGASVILMLSLLVKWAAACKGSGGNLCLYYSVHGYHVPLNFPSIILLF